MSIFSLDWFKSKKSKELENLQLEELRIKNELLKNRSDKPYLKVKFVNDNLTVVFNDGSILTKVPANIDDFNNVRTALTEAEIIKVMTVQLIGKEFTEKEESIREIELSKVPNEIEILRGLDDFEFVENSVYIRGIERTIPVMLLKKFIDVVSKWKNAPSEDLQAACNSDAEYVALKRFFLWCCLNPRAEVADKLYDFLMKNSFRITKQGFFVALRNVVSLEDENGSNIKVQFISNAYNKVKAVWKKNPTNYEVFDDNGYVLVESNKKNHGYNKHVGNLKDLYLDLPNMQENRFTDDWTKTFDIRIGRIVNMPMEECNWSTQDCAASGLHFTADEINYVRCGDTSILMLINPMKVVGIGNAKGRCYEYLPIMTVDRDEVTRVLHDLDFETLELDELYVEDQLEGLINVAKQGFVLESSKHQFNLPKISTFEINTIVTQLDRIKNDIRARVQKVV